MNRSVIKKYASYGAVVVLGGLLVAWSGIIPIAASSGHWPITAWFLHFVMRQSVQTHAMGAPVPPLDEPNRVLQGAGHYHTGCAPCHGAPGLPRSRIVLEMTPQPPYLPPKIHSWNPEDLFWIVKHGVKYTGMPAWVARERDDEVWSVVVFLLKLPTLSPEGYRRLARGESRPAVQPELADVGPELEALIHNCARCHGYDGLGRDSAFPKLPQLSPEYFHGSLQSYADNSRASGIMQPIAVELDEADMQALADFYTRQTGGAGPQPQDPSPNVLEQGRRIAEQGLPRQGVPPCAHCHGPDAVADNPFFPSLDGQYPDYLSTQLQLWQRGVRGGTPYAPVMAAVARGLKPGQIEAVAAYYGSLTQADPSPR